MLRWSTEWLNAHAEINKEQEWSTVTRDMYDEYDDPPVIVLDEEIETYLFEHHIVRILASPFHDEGGPVALTAIFVKYPSQPNEWELQNLYYEFDTYGEAIVSSGSFVDPRKRS